jgi:hypothetical protein
MLWTVYGLAGTAVDASRHDTDPVGVAVATDRDVVRAVRATFGAGRPAGTFKPERLLHVLGDQSVSHRGDALRQRVIGPSRLVHCRRNGKQHDSGKHAGQGNMGFHGLILFGRIGLSANLPLGRDEGEFGSKAQSRIFG